MVPDVPPVAGQPTVPGQDSGSSSSDTDVGDVFSPQETPSTRASSPDDDDIPISMTSNLSLRQMMQKRLQQLETQDDTTQEEPTAQSRPKTRSQIMTRARREILETAYIVHRRDENGLPWSPDMGFPWDKEKQITKDMSKMQLKTPKSEPTPKKPTKTIREHNISEVEVRGPAPPSRCGRSVSRRRDRSVKPSPKMLVETITTAEVKVDGSRYQGDHKTSDKLLITKWHRWADCRTCENDFLLDDTQTRKECPRCERHSKLYGYTWPKTDKADRFDKQERPGKLPESKLFVPKKEDTAMVRQMRRETILRTRQEVAEKKRLLQDGEWNEARMRKTSGRRGRSQSRAKTPEPTARSTMRRGRKRRGGKGKAEDSDSDTEMNDNDDTMSMVSAQSAFHGSEWASPRSSNNSTPKQVVTRRSTGLASV